MQCIHSDFILIEQSESGDVPLGGVKASRSKKNKTSGTRWCSPGEVLLTGTKRDELNKDVVKKTHTKWLHIYISCISYFPTLWWWYILGSPYFIPFLPCNGFAMHYLGVQFHLMGIQTGHAILPSLNSIQCLGGLEFPHNFIFPTMQQPILWFQISSNHSNHIISSPIQQPFSQIHIYI